MRTEKLEDEEKIIIIMQQHMMRLVAFYIHCNRAFSSTFHTRYTFCCVLCYFSFFFICFKFNSKSDHTPSIPKNKKKTTFKCKIFTLIKILTSKWNHIICNNFFLTKLPLNGFVFYST